MTNAANIGGGQDRAVRNGKYVSDVMGLTRFTKVFYRLTIKTFLDLKNKPDLLFFFPLYPKCSTILSHLVVY